MTVVICPGIHDSRFSDRFLSALKQELSSRSNFFDIAQVHVLPTQHHWPFNGFSVWSYLNDNCPSSQPLILIGFSAGVMGAVIAAQLWQSQGRSIAAVIGIDGWGVPQLGEFPFHRMSHDPFTHWSSALLGVGQDAFYADPSVGHLDMWQFPDRAAGWAMPSSGAVSLIAEKTQITAIAFIAQLLQHYGCCQIDALR